MRVLHYKSTMRAEEGGVVKAVFDLCVLTASPDLHIGLFTQHTDLVRENLPPDVIGKIQLHHLNASAVRPGHLLSAASLREAAAVIENYDLVHLHEMWTTSNPQIIRICRRLNKPYVLSVHGMLDNWCMAQRTLKKRVYLATWGRRLLADAARVHCTADAELDQAARWFDGSKGQVIPLPMELSPFANPPGRELAYKAFPTIDRDPPKVLFLSRLHPKKGVDRLIRASAILQQQGVDHQLLIAGTGTPAYTRYLRALVRREGVESTTNFLGFVNGSLKVSLFQAADVFALPTSQENFGFVFFEALAAGTPVITTNECDTWPELERSGGAVVSANNPESFAREIRRLLADPASRTDMGDRGRAWVSHEHVRDQVARRYVRLYQDCLSTLPEAPC